MDFMGYAPLSGKIQNDWVSGRFWVYETGIISFWHENWKSHKDIIDKLIKKWGYKPSKVYWDPYPKRAN
jgi:hypothetical protein